MRRGVVSVQVCEDWSERLARVQLLGRLRILGVHIHHEMGVRGEQRHLTSRIATIRTASIGLDELTNSKAIRGFLRGDGDVLAHHCFPQASRMARGSRNASIPYRPYSRPTPEYLNPPQGACGSSVMPLITTRPARICEATRCARWRSVPRTEACRPYLESLAIRIASSSEP